MPVEYPDGGNLKFSYKTLLIGAICTILISIVFIFICEFVGFNYNVRDILAIITCGIISTTLIYHAKNLKLNYELNKEKLCFDKEKFEEEKNAKKSEEAKRKKAYSFEKTEIWFKPDMAKHVERTRLFLLNNKGMLASESISKIKEELNKDHETKMALACNLNYFEHLALLIKNDIVDEEIVKQCFKTLFIDYYKILKRFIDEIQRSSSRYLINFEVIAKKWEMH